MRFQAAVFLFALLWSVSALPALGPHDIPSSKDSKALEGPCAVCHNTAETAAIRGWGTTTLDCTAGWFSRDITRLCWTCHSSGNTVGAHDVTDTAMNVSNHSYVIANAPPSAVNPNEHDMAPVSGSQLPYASGSFLQCTSCHNVHNGQFRPFLMKPDIRTLCDACHSGRNHSEVRENNTAGFDNVSVHPVNISMDNLVGGGVPASIKTISQMDNALKTPRTGGDNTWQLGGKLTGGDTGNLSCETCHAVHGPAGGGSGVNDLLAIDNRSGDASWENNPLCGGCHFGGSSGGATGLPGLTDHPFDNNAGKSYYPAGVSLPYAEWNGRLDRGAAQFNTAGRPRCSSCHDAHGGVGGTSLLRSPIPVAAGGNWCYSCHASSPVNAAPAAHHSASGLDNSPYFQSLLTCDMCHNGGSSGHNGFFSSYYIPVSGFTTPRDRVVTVNDVLSNKDSALCVYCHRDDDPLKWRNVFGFSDNATIDSMPRGHGTKRGTGSHFLGVDTDTFPGVIPKTDSWAADNSSAVSRYGASGEIICESCHSILFNEGAVHPSSYSGIDPAFRGWWNNLLLKPYEDDSPGTGQAGSSVNSDLCLGCHVDASSHHPLTGEVVQVTGEILKTGAGSLADQTNAPIGGGPAPGTLSFPGQDMMDCDSCHRPHSADSDSSVPSGTLLGIGTTLGRPGYLILEVDKLLNDWSSTLCLECHRK